MRALPRAVAVVLVVGLLSVLSLLGASPSDAQSGGEAILSYDSDVRVDERGAIDVVETIVWDFGNNSRHGIDRFIQTRFRYDEIKKNFDRVTPVSIQSVSVDGSPGRFETSDEDGFTKLRIGDPDRTITGSHTYVISYRMQGVLNHFEEHDELNFNLVGHKWPVPVSKATASIEVPGSADQVLCFAGPEGSTLPCDEQNVDGRTATFSSGALAPGSGMTAVVGFPVGLVPTPEPILEERWTPQKAFAVRPDTVAPAGGLLALAAAGVALIGFRVGRDRRFAGGVTDVAFGNIDGASERVPLRDRNDPIPVEFVPPDKIRPGQVGTLIDEHVHTLDVTATIIDLAVRGYLRITELQQEGWLGSADWQLEQLKTAQDLKTYEATLFTSLFAAGPRVRVSDLKGTFAAHLQEVEHQLYDDMVDNGWYRSRPDTTRNLYGCLGIAAVVAAGALLVALAAFTSYGLVGIALVIGALLFLAATKRMPSRTPKGYGTYRRILGFKQFIDESEKERAQFAEKQNLFSEYLPYAVVFGATEKWARAFSGIDGQLPAMDWYVSSYPFTWMAFSHGIGGFAVTTSGTIASAPPSATGSSGFSGGGFSGGGFGGGGGGSW